jgi:hypothetical protein
METIGICVLVLEKRQPILAAPPIISAEALVS